MLFTGTMDIFFVAASVVAIVVLLRNIESVRAAGGDLGVRSIVIGLAIYATFHTADLVLIVVTGFNSGGLADTQYGINRDIRMGVEATVVAIVLFGFVHLIQRLSGMLRQARKSNYELTGELGARQQLEQELKSEALSERASRRAKSSFLHTLSREMRTPLNGILGLASLLSNTELKDDQRKLLLTLEQSTQAMLNRVNDVVDLSQLEQDDIVLRSHALTLRDVLHSARARFDPLATQRGLELKVVTEEALDDPVIGDAMRIRQLVTHLLSNAIKYTTEGEVRIEAGVVTRDSDHEIVEIRVIDTGPGMTEEIRQRVSSLERLEESADPGIGLSIAWRLARLMDGGLTFDPAPGGGTKVTARLRLQREPDEV
ncbi:sensor histidine kinase [Maricaulis sp. CAU 1757]